MASEQNMTQALIHSAIGATKTAIMVVSETENHTQNA